MPVLALVELAIKKGLMRDNPFQDYEINMEETDRGYILKKDVEKLMMCVPPQPRYELVKDLFIFSCFTGLAYAYIKKLTRNEFIFPVPTNATCNTHIGKLIEKAEIITEQKVTFHTLQRNCFLSKRVIPGFGSIITVRILPHSFSLKTICSLRLKVSERTHQTRLPSKPFRDYYSSFKPHKKQIGKRKVKPKFDNKCYCTRSYLYSSFALYQQSKMKSQKIIYWSASILFSLWMLANASAYLTSDEAKRLCHNFGFPSYFRIELAIAKIIGVIVLLVPMIKGRWKEWAYAGFTITMISGFIAHLASGDSLLSASSAIIALAILLTSYFTYSNLKNITK